MNASSTTRQDATPLARACLLGASALALYLCAMTWVAVVKRVTFPYDFALWPDDYVLNELVKLRFGAPLYGSYDDANSYIYAPGGVLLHHALLSPFGLDLDIVANRILSQVWLALAVLLGVWVVGSISEGRLVGRLQATVGALGAGAALMLAGYSNSVVDTLHPATLELLMLTLAAAVAAQWPRFPYRVRIALSLVMPAGCMLAKQTGGTAAFALCAVALLTDVGSFRQRLTCAAACLASPALTFAALQYATHGAFARWGLLLPLSQPRVWNNALYIAASLTAIAPCLVLLIARAARALEQPRVDPHAAWLRVLAIPVAYVPAAMLAFLKMGGGAFDFGALAFLCTVLALSQVRSALSARSGHGAGGIGPLLVTLLAAGQLVLWSPRRHVPTAVDAAWSAQVCSHIAEALACGERVLIDQGMTCLIRGGITSAPLDRGFTIMELAWADLRDAGGTGRRLAAEEYDLLVFQALPLPGAWSHEALVAMNEHYTIYHTIFPAADTTHVASAADLDINERARLEGWPLPPMVLLERKRDSGRHRVDIVGPPRCRPAGR